MRSRRDGSLTQVIGPAGDVLAASANIAGNDPVLVAPPSTRTTATETRTDPPVGNNTVSTVSSLFLAGLPVVLAVVAASTWTAMVRVLRPVEKIREKAAAIGGSRNYGRVPVPATGDEVARGQQR